MCFESGSCPIELLILFTILQEQLGELANSNESNFRKRERESSSCKNSCACKYYTYQSNNLEYTNFANASLLSAADSGSRHLEIVSSGVTITRLQRESSSACSSHLPNNKESRMNYFHIITYSINHVSKRVLFTLKIINSISYTHEKLSRNFQVLLVFWN